MRLVTDQSGREVSVPRDPRRIVSLVPSQTELLCDLGVGGRVVAITRFCVHPARQLQNTPSVGGPRDPSLERIALQTPDLIIGSKEENDRSSVECLSERYPVWLSNVRDLLGALAMIRAIGSLVAREAGAESLAEKIAERFEHLPRRRRALRTAYAVWWQPLIVAGADTLIDDLLSRLGLRNVFGASSQRYPRVSLAELAEARPELVLLPSEPYSFSATQLPTLRRACVGARLMFVDGEMFSWYGSRLLLAGEYLRGFAKQLG